MSTVLRRCVVAGVAAVALLGTSCGVAADDIAASYRGNDIPTDVVDALAADPAFGELFGFPVGQSDAVVEATTARTVLDFLLEGTALVELAESEGFEVEPDPQLLATTIETLGAQGYRYGVEDLSEEARDFLARFVVADEALAGSEVDLGEPDEEDLRYVYEETAPSGRWERTCVTLVAVLTDDLEAAEAALDDGVELNQLPDEVPSAEVALDAEQACATSVDLGSFPPGLVGEVTTAESGRLVGPVEVDTGQGQTFAVYFEVQSVETVTPEQAREELAAEVGQSFLAVTIAREAQVNPRYGDGVGLEPTSGQGGQSSLVARVQRPPAPPGGPDPAQLAAP